MHSPIVHNELLGLADVEQQVVVRAPISVLQAHLSPSDMQPVVMVSSTGAVCGRTVVGEQDVLQGAEHTPLRRAGAECHCGGGDTAKP